MTNTIHIEYLGEIPLYLGLGLQVITSIVLGGIVGYDREKKMKSAGLKTNILICLGATLYTVISLLNIENHAGVTDPNRVGAQIVSGIGFLGAGAILQGRGSVIGMTTAASIWVVAAIGYTIGIGYPLIATIFSLTVLIVLKWLNPFYNYLENGDPTHLIHIQVLSLGSIKKTTLKLLKQNGLEIDEFFEDPVDKKRNLLNVYIHASLRSGDRFTSELKALASVEKVSMLEVTPADELNIDQEEKEKIIKANF